MTYNLYLVWISSFWIAILADIQLVLAPILIQPIGSIYPHDIVQSVVFFVLGLYNVAGINSTACIWIFVCHQYMIM